ncbi:hypothetical protein LCM10_09160 [Rossellomorea aquimaris]|uniref:hypothetical protein n=1 Tax=Rossellomorea aquimaris TaxID=189382 RepID=UPI001CD6D99A|nr:hypothetical protein [Rossellomorea aquimaris]MCA1055155.1 hypothetical protein [Rossellomorea aquimaris]
MDKEFILIFEDFHVSKKIETITKKHLVLFQGQQYYNRLVVVSRPPGFSHALEGILYSDKILETVGFSALFAVPIDARHTIPFKYVRVDDREKKPLDCKVVLENKDGQEKLNVRVRFPRTDTLSEEDRLDILSYLSHKCDDGSITYFLKNPNVYKGKGRKQED